MELTVEPDVYMPTFRNNIYQDAMPFDFTHGIRCPCSTRKDKKYNRRQFKSHLEVKKHKEWISYLNENRVNYYKKCIEQEETIKNQRNYIAQIEKELQIEKNNPKKQNYVTIETLLDIDL